jgi:DNA-directed RNA polymerase specialized sigma24 family protein
MTSPYRCPSPAQNSSTEPIPVPQSQQSRWRRPEEPPSAVTTRGVRVEAWLEDQRRQLREEVVEELEEVAAQLTELEAQRDGLIARLHRHGVSYRDIAAIVDLSHQTVANIIKAMTAAAR